MKILIADKLSPVTLKELEKLGADVTFNPDLKADDLPNFIFDNEILVVRSTKVKKDTIEKGTSLSLIIRAGAGVNTIDLESASRVGVYVANCPGENTAAVAELAIGLMISADRRMLDAGMDLRNGIWNKKEYSKAPGLKGRTLGIIGLGSIGKAVAARAQGLEMDVVAWSRSLTEEGAEELEIGYCATLDELAKKADAVSVHLAANDKTQHLIDSTFFDNMKNGAIFVNTSRGEVVDTDALIQAIKSKGLLVGLDVFEGEPSAGDKDFPNKELASMISCTPHIGASTDQAAEAIAAAVVRVVKSYVETGKPLNAVNIRGESSAWTMLVVKHFNKVGVLANVLNSLRHAGINVEEMENTIFSTGTTAVATLKLDDEPSTELLAEINDSEHVIQVIVK